MVRCKGRDFKENKVDYKGRLVSLHSDKVGTLRRLSIILGGKDIVSNTKLVR